MNAGACEDTPRKPAQEFKRKEGSPVVGGMLE